MNLAMNLKGCWPVAWMRMMGPDSVGYHERTVLGHEDDPVGNALEYYASRGETPMAWGGTGTARLGLEGEVDLDEWRAVFGTGGARHPDSGERLVHCMRPGMELVVSPHKSIAELGVIGRADDMHTILDAERDATMAYLDEVVQEQGGRRGRAQLRTPTEGLTWAVSRHATTRAGDPQVHDHVLVANLVRMDDERRGWKALDTGLLRDHLHAATAGGRMAAAAKAVELGYGIEPDPGRSGRLGGWAISGIPKEAWEVHANRSAQIEAAVGPDASYRSRSVAARATRDRKSHERVEDLVPRWREELARAGYPAPELTAKVERAGLAYHPPSPEILDGLAVELLGPGGRLASEKTFTRADVIVAVAPHLYGLPVSLLDSAVDKVLAHEDAIALPLVSRAREPVWAAACVVEDERRIADLAHSLAERPGPAVSYEEAVAAVRRTELARGFRLTERQAEVAKGLLISGHSLDLVVGVAGSGKTSTLSAVREGFEAAGYKVLGAATSGQAAKALGEGAGVTSRTVASLTWRIEHGQEVLSARHVLVLDEGSMTSDSDVGRLLAAVKRSGAKLVAVGDHRQLGSVGPGGALEALVSRHPGNVWTLSDNLRQRDPAERHALDHLRSGRVPSAVNWYRDHGRVHAARSKDMAMSEMVKAWADDVAGGREALLVAYHRDNVEALNRAAREAWEGLGELSGPELTAPGGRSYRAGDRVITLAPGRSGAWFTSQRAVVVSVEPGAKSLVARTPEGTTLHLGPEDVGSDKLAHAYAITAHRSQGSTVDVTYALEDGGGRELAYVAMSRARGESHVHVVASGPSQAASRLEWAWGDERRQSWAITNEAASSLGELYAEQTRLARSVPPDLSRQLDHVRRQSQAVEQEIADLYDGTGRWAHTSAGQAARTLREAALERQRAQQLLENQDLGRWSRHKARRALAAAGDRFDKALVAWENTAGPYATRLEAERGRLGAEAARLEQAQTSRQDFFARHPEVPSRLAELDLAIEHAEENDRRRSWELVKERERARRLGISHDLDRGYGMEL
jgi:conjugative relaxase-like TrwC/TraI family protein